MKNILLCSILLASSLYANQCCEQPERPYPKIQNCRDYNVFTFGEFLYWRYSSPNLVYGRDGVGITNSSTPTEIAVTKTGTSFLPDFDYDPGFREVMGV